MRGMNAGNANLLDLATQRLAWTDRRQTLLAQNIANADTPGFVPKDVVPFAQTLARASQPALLRTQPNHLPGTAPTQSNTQTVPSERAPDGNAVQLDQQLVAVADTETTQALVTAIYHKYLAMFGMALGSTSG